MIKTCITSKGRFVIPAKIRRQLGIKDGARFRIEVKVITRQIFLIPITYENVHTLRGKYKGKGLMKSLMAEKKRSREQ